MGELARAAAELGDGGVVGSAVVDQIARYGDSADLVPVVSEFVGSLVRAVKGGGGVRNAERGMRDGR
jgi:tryptophan synthase alpha subunit